MTESGGSFSEALKSLAAAWSSRYFRRYSGALFLQGAGRWAHEVALLWLVFEITGSALSVGFATAAGTGAQAVLAPAAGLLIDRVNRRMLLAAVDGAKTVIVGGLAVAVLSAGSTPPLWLLYVVVALLGMISALEKPLRKAFVRDVVSAGGLESATRLFTPVATVGRIAGSLFGALMLTISAAWGCFALNSAAAATTMLLVLSMPPSVGTITEMQRRATGYLWDYLKITPSVTVPLLLLVCFSLLAYNIPVTAQLFAETQLSAGPGVFGMLLSALSIGRLCGSVAAVGFGHSRPRTTALLLAAVGVTLTPMAVVGDVYVGLAAFWVVGVALGAFHSIANSAVQVAVDPRLQGRMLVVYGIITSWFRTGGAVLMGALADTLGTRATLTGAGAAIVGFACVTMFWLSRHSWSR